MVGSWTSMSCVKSVRTINICIAKTGIRDVDKKGLVLFGSTVPLRGNSVQFRSRPRDCKWRAGASTPLAPFGLGRSASRFDPQARKPARPKRSNTVGCDSKENEMNVTTTTQTGIATRIAPALFAAVLGLGIMFVVGHVQASTLHDAAHDVRHATGFPCH
jgi:cobalt transporter subunit CbtB